MASTGTPFSTLLTDGESQRTRAQLESSVTREAVHLPATIPNHLKHLP